MALTILSVRWKKRVKTLLSLEQSKNRFLAYSFFLEALKWYNRQPKPIRTMVVPIDSGSQNLG